MSSWIRYQPNPCGRTVGDCAVRAIAAALDLSWDDAYDLLASAGKKMCDLPNSDATWGAVLRANGFTRHVLPTSCPNCYTAEDFCRDHPHGVYVLGFGGHVATVIGGKLWDSWDSSNEIPVYYWRRD